MEENTQSIQRTSTSLLLFQYQRHSFKVLRTNNGENLFHAKTPRSKAAKFSWQLIYFAPLRDTYARLFLIYNHNPRT